MSKEKSVVAVARSQDVQENVTRVFNLLGGVKNMIEEGSTVVLKPNVGHANPPETAVCTNPETVRAVIREVKKANPKRIIIAESAAIGCDTQECFKVAGIEAVANEEGVELLDIKKDKDLITVPVRGYRSNIKSVKLPRTLIEAEHIINLPILKAHASMVFSCALKNIKGTVQDKVHFDMHKENLTMSMMDVWYAVRPDINIVDAMYVASGFSPHTPVPLEVNCVLGSYDPVAVDLVACDIVGIDTEKVDYFAVAAETGLGNTDRSKIEVVGEDPKECFRRMWIPYLDGMDSWPEYNILHENACSSCQALLALNMESLKAIGEYEKNADTTIVIGKKDSIPEDIPDDKLVLHGNCTRSLLKNHPNAKFITGCPPAEICLYATIIENRLMDASTPENVGELRGMMETNQPVWRTYVENEAQKFYGSK